MRERGYKFNLSIYRAAGVEKSHFLSNTLRRAGRFARKRLLFRGGAALRESPELVRRVPVSGRRLLTDRQK